MGRAQVQRADPSPEAVSGGVPSLMDVLAASQARIVEQLGETHASGTGLNTDDAEHRLRVLFWAEQQTEELRTLRENHRLTQQRERDDVRQTAASGWLRVGHRASRLALAIAVVLVVILALAGLWLSGHLDPAQALRLVSGA